MKVASLLFIFLVLSPLQDVRAQSSFLENLRKIREATENLDVIYGNDDRRNISIESPAVQELAQSVGLRVSKKRLLEDRDDESLYIIPARTLSGTVAALCEDEAFKDEQSLGDCSGVLIAPNKLLTAGHCVKDETQCSNFRWVFGFTKNTDSLEKSQVYSCQKIIKQKYEFTIAKEKSETGDKAVKFVCADYAVIELDRPVTNYVPVKMRTNNKITYGNAVFMIGHPMGLPMKITDGAKAMDLNLLPAKSLKTRLIQKRLSQDFFTANLDSYAGNSGSPVFNQRTGELEGIITQGTEDFQYNYKRDCQESRRLSNNPINVYEKVMRITKIPGLSLLVK